MTVTTFLFGQNSTVPPVIKVSLMSEWEAKMQAIVEESSQENVTGLMGVPSWMLVLLHKLIAQNRGKSLKDIWPNIRSLFSWRSKFSPLPLSI